MRKNSVVSRVAFTAWVALLCYPAVLLADSRTDSVRDRTVVSSGFSDFKRATSVPAVSPAAQSAQGSDTVVTIDGMPAETLQAVVLRPRENGRLHVIDAPPAGADHRRYLTAELRAAREAGVGRVSFPQGYRFVLKPPGKNDEHLEISGFRDTDIDLNGSTLELTRVSRGLLLRDNERLMIRNGTVENRRSVLATVARVRADGSPGGVRFDVLPEYRAALEASGNTGLFTLGPAEPAPGGGWRIRPDDHRSLFVNRGGKKNRFAYRSGRYVSTAPLSQSRAYWRGVEHVWLQHQNNSGHGILMLGDGEPPNRDITLQDLVLRNIPGMAIFGEIGRGLHITGVSVEAGSVRGAPSVLANASDSVHINANGGDIVIENSYFGPNADDKVNIKGNWWRVKSVDRRSGKLVVQPVERRQSVRTWGTDGQRVAFIDGGGAVIGEARLSRDSARGNDGGAVHSVWIDRVPASVKPGSIIGNVDNAGPRVVVRDNVFEDSRAQGVLVQSSHVAVLDNLFAGIAGPAVKVNFALGVYYEGIDVSNALIQGNTFERSALAADKPRELVQLKGRDRSGRSVSILGPVRIVSNVIDDGTGADRNDAPVDDGVPDVPDVPDQPVKPGKPSNATPSDGDLDGIVLKYENKAPGAGSETIEGQVELVNRSSTAVDLSGAEVRYFADADGLLPEAKIRRVRPSSAKVQAAWVVNGANSHLALRLRDVPVLAPGAKLLVRFEAEDARGRTFDQSNDRSWIGGQMSSGPNTEIALVRP